MSIQLADLQKTYYFVIVDFNGEIGHNYFMSIVILQYQFSASKFWYLTTANRFLLFSLENAMPLNVICSDKVMDDYLKSKELDEHKYETAEQALAVLQAWADKFGYTLRALS